VEIDVFYKKNEKNKKSGGHPFTGWGWRHTPLRL